VRRFNHAILIALAVLTLPGCLFDPDIEDVVHAIEHEIHPATLQPEATVHVGRGLLTVARALVSFVPDDDVQEAKALLRGIHDVHVGVYQVEGLDGPLKLPSSLRDRLADDGWQFVAQVQENGSSVYVLAQSRKNKVGGVYVVIHENDELVVAKLKGNLSHTIDMAVRQAMKKNPHMFDDVIEGAS
jgi:hypothetical protein